jgi:hypothetical protein
LGKGKGFILQKKPLVENTTNDENLVGRLGRLSNFGQGRPKGMTKVEMVRFASEKSVAGEPVS